MELGSNMRVLFLDFDGVIHIAGKFSKAACKNLSKLLDADPELKIVISSSWRHKGLKYCKEALEENGVDSTRVIDRTDLKTGDRGKHIERWIAENKPTHFVIIDDHNHMDKVKDRLVQINPFVGLTSGDNKKALDILKKSV
jgi:hypothetical protein